MTALKKNSIVELNLNLHLKLTHTPIHRIDLCGIHRCKQRFFLTFSLCIFLVLFTVFIARERKKTPTTKSTENTVDETSTRWTLQGQIDFLFSHKCVRMALKTYYYQPQWQQHQRQQQQQQQKLDSIHFSYDEIQFEQ